MAQMINVKCTACGAQRKVPEGASAIACRKCGAKMAAPQPAAAAAAAVPTVARGAPRRPGTVRGKSRGKPSGRARASRRAPVAEPARPAQAPEGRGRPGRPTKKQDNTPIIVTAVIGCGLLVTLFFVMVSGPGDRTLQEPDTPTASSSGNSGDGVEVLEPWDVCAKFKNQVALKSGAGILEYFDIDRHAQVHGKDQPSGTSQREKYAESMRHDLPDWLGELYLSAEHESPGSSSNEVIVTGQRNRKPAMEFRLARSAGAAPWMVYDFKVLGAAAGGTTMEDEGDPDGVATVVPGSGIGDSDGAGEDDETTVPAQPRRGGGTKSTDYLADYTGTTDEDRAVVEKAIADIMSGDPSRLESAEHRIRDVGGRSIPIIIRFLKPGDVDHGNFTSANSVLNILEAIAPGDIDDKPGPADLMGGQDAAVRNKIYEWRDWWKSNHKKYRE